MLLVRPQDAMRDQWEGATVNPEAAVGAFGMDAAHALGTDAAAAAVEELLGRGAAGEAEEAGEVTAVCVPSVDGFYDPRVVADGLRDLLCMNVERGGEEEEGVLVDGEDETLTEDEDESAGVAARPVRPARPVRDVRDVRDVCAVHCATACVEPCCAALCCVPHCVGAFVHLNRSFDEGIVRLI